MAKRYPMTLKGFEELKRKLKEFKEVERPKIIQDIETARAHGDLSENAEYHAAKEKQGLLEARIRDIEEKLSLAEIINIATLSGDRVIFGATVTLYDVNEQKEITYTIVGDDEAEATKGRISYKSPVARAILGKVVDEEVEVETPGGTRVFEIMNVEFIPI